MARVVRFPTAPRSSASHDLKVHIENARNRRDMRAVLQGFEQLSMSQPSTAAIVLQWLQKFLRDLGKAGGTG